MEPHQNTSRLTSIRKTERERTHWYKFLKVSFNFIFFLFYFLSSELFYFIFLFWNNLISMQQKSRIIIIIRYSTFDFRTDGGAGALTFTASTSWTIVISPTITATVNAGGRDTVLNESVGNIENGHFQRFEGRRAIADTVLPRTEGAIHSGTNRAFTVAVRDDTGGGVSVDDEKN